MKKSIFDCLLWVSAVRKRGDMLDVTFQVIGEAPGREMVKSFPIGGRQVWQLREMLEACGKEVPRKVVRLNIDKMIGLQCAGTITDDGDGKMAVCVFFPVRELKQQFAEALRKMEFGLETPRYVM